MAHEERRTHSSLESPLANCCQPLNFEHRSQPPKKRRRYQRCSQSPGDSTDSSIQNYDDSNYDRSKSSAQLVPASPHLCDLSDNLSESFHSPAVKKESILSTTHTPHTSTTHTTHTPHTSTLHTPRTSTLHTSTPPPTSGRLKPLRSQTVKRSLDFSKATQERSFDGEWLKRVSSSEHQQKRVSSLPSYTPPTLSASTLLGLRASILPDHHSRQAPSHSSETPNFNHMSITRYCSREE